MSPAGKRREKPSRQEPAGPIDVSEGVPDRCAKPAGLWFYLLLAAAFVAWLALLAYCWLTGSG